MISEISENDFDAVDFKFHTEEGMMNGKEVIPLKIHNPNFVSDILNRKFEGQRSSKRSIEPMMAGCSRVEVELTIEDSNGNKGSIKVTAEKERDKETGSQGQASNVEKHDPPDTRDRDRDNN